MTTPYLVTTTHTPTLMCGCPACVAAYLASLAASGNKAAYDAAVKTIGTGSLIAVAPSLAAPPAPTVAAVAAGSPASVQVPVVPPVAGTPSIPQPVGSFNPATLGISVGTLSYSASGGKYANAAYLGPYDDFSEIDYTTGATTPQTYYAAVTLGAGANYIFDLVTYSYGYQSGSQNFGVSLELFNSSGVQQTTTASGTGYGGIAITPSTSGTYYVEIIATGNPTNFWSLFDLRSAVSSPLPAATYTSVMPDGLSNATYVQALLAGGGSWWHVPGGGITPTATDGLSGAKHSITYSFLTSDYSGDTTGGFAAMGANEQTAVKAALTYISSLFDITFTQVAAGTGMINYGSNDQGSVSAGYSFYANTPGGANVMISNNAIYGYNNSSSYAIGTYAWETLLHETGHALGLKHPGNYNAGGGGTVAPYLPTDMDNRGYSIMSYNDPANITYTSDATGGGFYFNTLNPTTYQLIDFYALQYLYGANTTTTSLANQTFSWGLNQNIMETIYSIGSGSTIDLSNQTLPSVINLNDGTFSSIDERLNPTDLSASLSPNVNSYGGYGFVESNYASEAAQLYTGVNDLAIAPNAQIDILKLGGGTDTVTANNDGDTIYLGSGTDTVTGGTSNDVFYLGTGSATINGGGGNNSVHASVTQASANVSYSGGTTTLSIGGATDTLTNIASIVFTDGTYTPGYNIPTITASNTTLTGLDASYAASSLFSVVDHNGVASSALTYTLSDTGSGGHFYVNGVQQAYNTPFTITASQLNQTAYIANLAGGTDTISMTVNDGIGSTTQIFTITSPGLTVAGVTLNQSLRAQGYAATALFASAMDGAGSITSYTFDDTSTSANAGYFVLNGVQQANNTPITVSAAQLSTLTYVSPQFGTDTITVVITDGSLSSAAATTTVIGPSVVAPTLTVQSTTLTHGVGSTVALSSLISAIDNNGFSGSALTYTLSDSGGAGGFFYNGTSYGSSATFTAAQLAQATYVSKAASGTDTITVMVSDGASSSTKTFTIANHAPVAPVVSAVNVTTAGSGATYANFANVISFSDSNGVSASGITYTVSYSGTGGVLSLDGYAKAAGTSFTVSGTDLTGLSFTPSVAGGTATVTVTAYDTYAYSTAKTFTITSPNTPGPVVTAVPSGASLTTGLGGGTFSLSQLYSEADANPNATVLQYQLEFVPGTGSVGGFSINGVTEPGSTAFDVNPSDLGSVIYNITSGTQTLYMRGNDGTGTDNSSTAHWGAWTKLVVTVPAAIAPVVTAKSITLSGVSSNFASAAAIVATDFNGVGQSLLSYSVTYNGTGGTLYLGGTQEIEGTAFTVMGTQLSALSYSPTLFGGTDTFTVSVSDGYTTSTPVSFTVTSPNSPGPVVTAVPTNASLTTALGGGSIALSQLFSVNDAYPGATITQYEFEDVASTGSVGNFAIGPTAESNGVLFYVSPGDISSLGYNITSGSQILYMRANDGPGLGTATNAHWGAWTKVTVTVPTPKAPVLTANSITLSSVTSNFASAASIVATDLNGVSASSLTYTLSYTGNGGLLQSGGSALTEGSNISLTPTQLAALSFNPSFLGGTDTVTLKVSDGYATSSVVFTVTAPNSPGPVVTAVPANASLTTALGGGSIALSQLYSVYDAYPGASVTQYEFEDVASAGSVGNLSVGSTVEANGAIFYVSPGDISSVGYNITAGSQILYMRANDGPGLGTAANAHWGAWTKVTVTVPTPKAPVLTAKSITLSTVTSNFVTAASIVATDLNGVSASSLTYTLNYTGNGGLLQSGGSALTEGSNISLTPTQLAALSFNPSFLGGTDTVTLKVSDGYATSSVVFTVTSPNSPGPVVTAVPANASLTTALGGATLSLSQLYSVYDAYPGASVTQYEFEDVASAGSVGNISIGPTVEANGAVFYVAPGDISSFDYNISSGSQILYMRANDGPGLGTAATAHWGAWTKVTVSAPIPKAPVLTAKSITLSSVTSNFASAASIVATDLNGVSASSLTYTLSYTGNGGLLQSGGSALTEGSNISLTPTQLAALSFNPSFLGGTDTVTLKVSDGYATSSVVITVTSPNSPGPVVTSVPTNASLTVAHGGASLSLSQLYSVSDAYPGAIISQYEFEDVASTGSIGNISIGPTAETNGVLFYVAPGDISSFAYNITSGSQILYMRANDGPGLGTAATAHWGAWSKVTVSVAAAAGVGARVASAPVIHIPNLSSAVVSSPSVAVSSVVSPASLLTAASQQPSSLFAVHHA